MLFHSTDAMIGPVIYSEFAPKFAHNPDPENSTGPQPGKLAIEECHIINAPAPFGRRERKGPETALFAFSGAGLTATGGSDYKKNMEKCIL